MLRVLPGQPADAVTGLVKTLRALTGTPQDQVDWKEPDVWIPQRLSGDHRDLAEAIWSGSAQTLNPRYMYGHWLLCRNYDLLDGSGGALVLTERGSRFLKEVGGDVERSIDEEEGLIETLDLVARRGPTRLRAIEEEWASYLDRYSGYRSRTSQRGMLRQRVANLVDRGLVHRSTALYSATDTGLTWLAKGPDTIPDELGQLIRQTREHSAFRSQETLA